MTTIRSCFTLTLSSYRGTKGTVLFVPLFTTPSRAIFRGTKRTVPCVPLCAPMYHYVCLVTFCNYFGEFACNLKLNMYLCGKIVKAMDYRVTFNCLSNKMNDKLNNNQNLNNNQVLNNSCCSSSRTIW